MEYKLFDDYITLQALLKETGIIQSDVVSGIFLRQIYFREREKIRQPFLQNFKKT